ncbi:hypothetical protein MKW94_010645 [Papaver nudicaule]|uniref:NAC domain-containing protein n=1 Tax=Papaver nudicaule TaxID=74823 RepID=A0AA41V6S5_PAPNU|nr:hypothetical protein [Papaver nudicaule]
MISQNPSGQETDQVLHFFSTVKKIRSRIQRGSQHGWWKKATTTPPPISIYFPGTEYTIGYKQDFTFAWRDDSVSDEKRRNASASGRWRMTEYSIISSFYQNNNKKEHVLCRIKRIRKGKDVIPQLQPHSVTSPVRSTASSLHEAGSSSSSSALSSSPAPSINEKQLTATKSPGRSPMWSKEFPLAMKLFYYSSNRTPGKKVHSSSPSAHVKQRKNGMTGGLWEQVLQTMKTR